MTKLVHNEQVKLRATFFNNLGSAMFLGAIFLPGSHLSAQASRSRGDVPLAGC
jgi:hypothetical protein